MAIDLSTVTDEQLCKFGASSWHGYVQELAKRFRKASAIASAAREAGMVDETGRFRKILGTLPVTADDVIVLPGAKVWPRADLWIFNDEFNENWTPDEESAEVKLTLASDAELDDWDVTTCYSTPDAARSAAEAAKGGGE